MIRPRSLLIYPFLFYMAVFSMEFMEPSFAMLADTHLQPVQPEDSHPTCVPDLDKPLFLNKQEVPQEDKEKVIKEGWQHAWEYFVAKSNKGRLEGDSLEREHNKTRAPLIQNTISKESATGYVKAFFAAYCKNPPNQALKKMEELIEGNRKSRKVFLVEWFEMLNSKKQTPTVSELDELSQILSRGYISSPALGRKGEAPKRSPSEGLKSFVQTVGIRPPEDQRLNLLYGKFEARLKKAQGQVRPCGNINNVAGKETFKEPRNQSGTGWCAAHSLADMITHRLGQKISAVALAKDFQDEFVKPTHPSRGPTFNLTSDALPSSPKHSQKKQPPQNSEGDCENYALLPLATGCLKTESLIQAALRKGGVCSEKEVPSWEIDLSGYDSGSDTEAGWRGIDGFEVLFDVNIKKHCERTWNMPYENLSRDLTKFMPLCLLQHKELEERLNKCQRIPLEPPSRFEVTQELIGPETINKLNQQLDQGEIVAMGISTGFFHTSDAARASTFFGDHKPNHSLLVVGREQKNGQCGYILRNSWGHDCPRSLDKPHVECDSGVIWVSESRLLLMSEKMTSFKSPR